jgi:predicted HicB family RNase H-like nuclease/predicted RNA binding protein YcfA (HicA-like mRNA interferase family)
MPRKIRQLISQLESAGFENRGGKGSHRNFVHPKCPYTVKLSGNPSSDALTLSGKDGKSCFSRGEQMNKISANYLKVVEWSEEDNCFVGTAPGLFIGGVHGKNEGEVFRELQEEVEATIRLMQNEGMTLPPTTANKDYSGKIALRISQDLHKRLAIKATQLGESLNKFIQQKLETVV